jgi:phosphopantetheine adenylyltransferase
MHTQTKSPNPRSDSDRTGSPTKSTEQILREIEARMVELEPYVTEAEELEEEIFELSDQRGGEEREQQRQ